MDKKFWCKGYDIVGKNKVTIEDYIRNQSSKDKIAKQLSFKELIDLFMGKRNKNYK